LRIDYDSIQPIYVQVAEAIEDEIMSGRLREGGPVYSQLELSRELGINPATAAKGINALVQKGVLEKQRGLSMAVARGARNRVINEKIKKDFANAVSALVEKAISYGLTEEQVQYLIGLVFKRKKGGNHSD
jgi:DNA-binding transcriptional regulator YhcF (GntR family)